MRAEHWIYTFPLRIRSLFRRRSVEQEMDEELSFHIDQQTEQYVARGMIPSDARTAVLRELGGIERRKEEIRETRRIGPLENIGRDVRYSLRGLRRTPGFTAIAILTLALGIGANTAIFTVVNGVLLRPLPYADPGRIVVLPGRGATVAPGTFLDWQDASRSYESMGLAQYWTPTLTGVGHPEQLTALQVTAGMFRLLGVAPLLGRTFLPEEEHAGKNRVVVLRYEFWRDRFALDSGVLGHAIVLDGDRYTIIGVMPKGFLFAPFWSAESRFWVPLPLDARRQDRAGASMRGFARLRPGVTLAGARAEMATIAARLEPLYPGTNLHVTIFPLQQVVVGDVSAALLVLLIATTLVLLIACANVTHLQLMRGAARERENAMRLSLGATRGRLLQQSLVESLLLALAGGGAGLVLAVAGVRAVVALAPSDIPRIDSISIDARVFVVLLTVAVVTGFVSGLAPALSMAAVDPHRVLKESGRGGGNSARRQRAGRVLVVSEYAMAVILLVGAGLVLRSFAAMLGVDPGFDPKGVVTTVISTHGTADEALPGRNVFYSNVLDRIAALPQVASVGAINHVPLHGDYWHFTYFVAGRPKPPPDQRSRAIFRVVRPGYFATMRIPLLRGRSITAQDMNDQARVVVIDESMARASWPGADPIGHRISVDDPDTGADWFTIVGVVKDVRESNWSGVHTGEMYYPYWAGNGGEPSGSFASLLHPNSMSLVIRSTGIPMVLIPSIRRIVAGLDPDVPVADVITLEAAIAEQVAAPGFYLALLAGFAVIALILAVVGIYGVVSYAISMRTREIGIRLALGAGRQVPFRLVVGQGLRLALLGALIGTVGALGLTRYLRTLLYGIGPTDLITFAITPALLVVVAVVACYVPARRATRIDPMVALRAE